MGPKKKIKKKAASAASTNAAIATNEDELRKRVEEAEAQLREEAKIIERMTRDNKSKQDQINVMETLLQREAEKHQETLRLVEDEHATQKQQAEHEIEVLRRQVRQLELHVEAYDVVEAANLTLRERVEQLMEELEQENKTHAEEIHKVRLDMFNHKMALEKTFRKSLQELDADYLKKAFNAMSEESKNALVANAKLKDELQLQSIGVDNLMQRFTEQAKHFHKMKVENEILEQESHFRLQEVAAMKKIHLTAARTINKLKDDVGKEEQEWKEHANKVIEDLRRDNHHLHKLHELAQKRSNKWKTRCMVLTERETARRMDEQRAKSAPTAATALSSMFHSSSQSSLEPRASVRNSFSARERGPAVNFDEMWSASFAKSASQQQLVRREENSKRCSKSKSTKQKASGATRAGREGGEPPNNQPLSPNSTAALVQPLDELERIAHANLDMLSAQTLAGDSGVKKPNRVAPTILPRKGQSVDVFNFTM